MTDGSKEEGDKDMRDKDMNNYDTIKTRLEEKTGNVELRNGGKKENENENKTNKENNGGRHIFRNIGIGFAILWAIGATEELTRVYAANGGDWGKAYGAKQKEEATVFAGYAVKMGDKFFKIENNKLTGQQIYLDGAKISEDGKTAEVYEIGIGFVTWSIIDTINITQTLFGSFEINGVTLNTTTDIEDKTVMNFGEDGDKLIHKTQEVAVKDGGLIWVRGVDEVDLDESKLTMDGETFYYDGVEVVEVTMNRESVSSENSQLKGLVKETGAEQTPTTPTDEEQKDSENGENKESNGEASAVETQEKQVTYSDVDALNQLNAQLTAILSAKQAFAGHEVKDAKIDVLDLQNGILVFTATVDGKNICQRTGLNIATYEEVSNNLDAILVEAINGTIETIEAKENAQSVVETFNGDFVNGNFFDVTPVQTSLNNVTVYEAKSVRVAGNKHQKLFYAYVEGVLYSFQMEIPLAEVGKVGAIIEEELPQVIAGKNCKHIDQSSCERYEDFIIRKKNQQRTVTKSVSETSSTDYDNSL